MAGARQLFLDLLMRDKTGAGARSASKNLGDVADAADGAARSTEKLGKESSKSDGNVRELGRSSKGVAGHMSDLDDEIANVNRELMQMALAWKMAESAAERSDISKAIRKTQRDLKEIQKNKGLLSGLLGDPDEGGKSFAKRLSGGISAGLSEISGTLGGAVGPTVGGAIGIAAAPFLLSSLSSAVAAGAGVAVLGVGIMAAVKGDKDIQAAGKEAGRQFTSGLQDAATKSLKGPILESLGIVSAAGDRLNRDLAATFDALSGHVVPFTKKVVGAGEAITGSLLGAARRSGPAIDDLGDSVGLLGDGVAKFIDNVADGGPQAAENMKLLAASIGDTVAATGKLIGETSKLSDNSIAIGLFGKLLKDGYASLIKATDGASDAQKNLTPSILTAGEAAGKAGQQMQTYADSLNEAASKGRGLYDSQTDVAQAFADTEKAVKANGHTLDINSQKGRDNRKVLSDLAGKLTANYEAYVKVNGEGGAAAGVAERNRSAFIRLASQFTGSRRAAEALADQMGLIKPKTINFYANTHDAAARLDALKGKISSVKGKTVTVHVSVTGTERLDQAGHRIGGYRAAGGPVRKGKAYVVGEKRPEVFVPDRDGQIIPSIDKAGSALATAMNARSASSSSDGGWVAIRGDAVFNALVQGIASTVSAKGGRAAQLGIRFT